ncbi:MAG: MAPEG family protein [Steroidobacteraceae bacterium]
MILTFAVWLFMYCRRIPFVLRSRLTASQLAPLEFARLSPPAVSNPSDNLRNLFEIPTLFYALVLYLFVVHRVDSAYLFAAWAFVGFRALHSLVHCTINIVVLRFWLYAVSTAALWLMLGRAAIAAVL